ncbi:efflux transporter outer membrane subunit [Ottowia thiooxydans]|uniref:efflux transporter outer membrane subunit n=1 Tax=Ottowia thiooxydans TaxID=219182 RepID=UPI000404B445|nr:efflux transporter outer membrane subunit [Ottowia thiooxydans]
MAVKTYRIISQGISLTLLALLGACSMAPHDNAPSLDVSTTWKSAQVAEGWISADAARAWEAGEWWTLFKDPVLAGLMARVEISNQNLALAVANVAQAQALLAQQQAALWPTLGVQGGVQRSGGSGSTGAGSSITANLSASWAPDLWGRLGDAARAQAASVQASQADLANARLSAQGNLASAYFALREADAEIALLDETVKAYERSTQITQNRYDAGVAARTDLLQAQGTLVSAQASRTALRRSRAIYENAIALLLGQAPADFSLAATQWVGLVPEVPAGLPSALLLRRPDIARAERSVAAANLQIGVARSAYFPSLTLSASGGQSTGFPVSNLFSASNMLWSLGLSVAETIFDAGARQARVDQTLAARDGAIATYRQTALTAMGQVEDQLTTLQTLAVQAEQTRQAADAAARVEQQVLNSYQAGLTAYTAVVTAQATSLSQRRGLLQLELQRQQAAVGLIQALGGGWQAPWTTGVVAQ